MEIYIVAQGRPENISEIIFSTFINRVNLLFPGYVTHTLFKRLK